MPQPVYISRESDALKLEGVYIMRKKPPPAVAGVELSDVVIVGTAARGPVDRAVRINSMPRFAEVFGGRDYGSGGAIRSEIWKAIVGREFGALWVVRAAAAAASKSTANLSDANPTAIVRVDASSVGKWSDGTVSGEVLAASDGDGTHWNLSLSYLGRSILLENLNTTAGVDNLAVTLGDDDGRWVDLTKLADGRPVNGTFTITGGADGSIADTDFTATTRALDVAFAKTTNVVCWLVVGRSTAAVKSSLKTRAAKVPTGFVLMCPDTSTVSKATAITEAGNNQVDGGRVLYAFNHPVIFDPETGQRMTVEPHAFLASILSQIEGDKAPTTASTKQYLAAIDSLSTSLSRPDLEDLRAGGIMAIADDRGFVFWSGVTTDGLEAVDVRAADTINETVGRFLGGSKGEGNTKSLRTANVGAIDDKLSELVKAERYLEAYQLDGEILNTPTSRGQNIEKLALTGRLISHMNFIIVESQLGTTVQIVRR